MTQTEQGCYALEAVRVAVNHHDEAGALLRVDERLTAVLVRLDAEYNGEHRGCWYVEAGFGRCSGHAPPPFRHLSDALDWVAGRLPTRVGNLPEVLAQAAALWA